MGLSYEDYLPRLAAANAKVEAERVQREQVKAGVKIQLRELLVDPRWEIYAQQVDVCRANAQNSVLILTEKLGSGLSADEYVKVLAELRYQSGLKAGFTISLALAKETVTK